ncbi:uncharacterized protein LOC130614695 [Hydractinia symbiolongicarpus]|uniref:uncharacterized protein LOC130614695 n=1 Tax=Hydractinia symbiolongicarpus TaxID=13093 RepID=UPI0025501E56|nr:uncharacterized protein LOC130614695 [Hydractinia symbiolongicarpus]XP_057292117.1 uncharacterized protein LOC130614695 [Hydractinia symbiolongicarpus]XP_057292118.1 uncharacterized protein LOC130614695 [Hydractinia symbiolongicarpus]
MIIRFIIGTMLFCSYIFAYKSRPPETCSDLWNYVQNITQEFPFPKKEMHVDIHNCTSFSIQTAGTFKVITNFRIRPTIQLMLEISSQLLVKPNITLSDKIHLDSPIIKIIHLGENNFTLHGVVSGQNITVKVFVDLRLYGKVLYILNRISFYKSMKDGRKESSLYVNHGIYNLSYLHSTETLRPQSTIKSVLSAGAKAGLIASGLLLLIVGVAFIIYWRKSNRMSQQAAFYNDIVMNSEFDEEIVEDDCPLVNDHLVIG